MKGCNSQYPEEFKSLIPVIITKRDYLPGANFTNENVNSRVKTTVFRSIPDPKCNYVTFIQETQSNDLLSSLYPQENAPSVIQFLTTQFNYKIEWSCSLRRVTNTRVDEKHLAKMTNNSGIDLGQKVRYLTLDADR